ncbi:hypothetical protein SEA_WOFFORD_175 [Streptomyces phage Wofford]|uniref:Uncharacterized protein n=2 Tax=Karimacvirus TaxID=2843400 RepID=A0A345M8T0_9CAUD|nr:hypothetical protein HWB77_gp136 [Streptomyces phage StarPlatinum]YP_009839833.1 hypothetical protein HWB78_gp129 [Streptomyces phage Wollford]AXH66901.1 hypothetical protein SEA_STARPLATINUM_183 [Streptomyces phage StarPlatinum]AXH67326.1 hypothetical protein SEA_WOFFORD_175 [Streptomyces phage Wollford]
MPGPMSRPDGVRENAEQRKERGRKIIAGKPVKTGKTAKK